MRLGLAEEIIERRHGIAAAFADGFHDGVGAAAVQPGLVGQVWRAHHLIALPIGAMTGCAGAEFSAAAIDGICPLRPFMIVALMTSGSPPYNQSRSVRFGKPLLPRASVPWL